MRKLLRRIRCLLRRERFERELAEEMQFHREMAAREFERRGLDAHDAAAASRCAFGSGAFAADQARDVWIPPAFKDLWQDMRFAMRLLRKDRWFSIVAVGTLALGIGANTTLFTIVTGMGASAPVADPNRAVALGSLDGAGRKIGVSYLDFQDWRRQTRSFKELAAYAGMSFNVTDPGLAPERVPGAYISSTTFPLLDEQPILGRNFVAADDRPGAPPVVIIASAIWKTRYGGNRSVVGQSMTVNGMAATVIGVMRDGFGFPLIHKIWMPLAAMPGIAGRARDVRTLDAFGRLADSVSLSQARSELTAIASHLTADYPITNANIRPSVTPYGGHFDVTNPWNAMLVAVGIVLLIACANVASLLLVRSAHRSSEIAVRTALGATRWRIVRQLLVESLLLAVAAGILGLGIGTIGVRLWVASMPESNWPYWYRFEIDWRTLVYVLEVSLGSAVVFGLAPALHLSRHGESIGLKNTGRDASRPTDARRWTTALLVVEFALTLTLLAGAGLLTRTLLAVYKADALVDTSHLVLASLSPSAGRYPTAAQRLAFYDRVQERLAAIPTIQDATIASAMPFYTAPVKDLAIDGRPSTGVHATQTASYVTVGKRYFETLGLHLLAGRTFTALDGSAGREATIVNQRFASMYFGASNAIGQRIRVTDPNRPSDAPWLVIVGISPTVRQHYAQEFDPVVYVPYRADPGSVMNVIAKARVDSAALTPTLREEIRALDPDLPIFNIMQLDNLISGTRFANRVFATLFSVSAGIALLLAAVGLHAIIAYTVNQRTQEIGVRMALGATAGQLVWLFVRRLIVPLALGLTVGFSGAIGAGQFIRGMLIQTSPYDPVTLMSITIVLTIVALIAAFLPARRATRLDPVAALRHE